MPSFWKLLSLLILSQTATSEIKTPLQQDNLNPNDFDYDEIAKNNDKRTIFANNIENYGWAKHVAIHPSGKKYVLGYGAVDLKYVPVARPINLRPHLKQPWFVKPVNHGWKPSVPVTPVNIQVPPHIHPWQYEGWTRPVPEIKPISIQPIPAMKPVLPVKPAVPVVPFRPLIPHFRPVPQPFIPSPHLFEVTKPNLGVLPFGASFPSPVLSQIPVPVPIPAPPPRTVEYHGTHHFVPVGPAPVPVQPPVIAGPPAQQHIFSPPVQSPSVVPQYLPPAPVNAVLPHHFFHLQVQIPQEHGLQTPLVPQPQNIFPPFQQLPLPEHGHFQPQQFQQELPENGQQLFNPLNQQVPLNQLQHLAANQALAHSQQIFQQQLPEGQQNLYNQISIDHSTNAHQGLIQPGQTDLQLPLHLPQHHNYLAEGQQESAYNEAENVFRPSISLEPPYKK